MILIWQLTFDNRSQLAALSNVNQYVSNDGQWETYHDFWIAINIKHCSNLIWITSEQIPIWKPNKTFGRKIRLDYLLYCIYLNLNKIFFSNKIVQFLTAMYEMNVATTFLVLFFKFYLIISSTILFFLLIVLNSVKIHNCLFHSSLSTSVSN